ncbi:MAG: SDR family oxidoreductase [Deltaproteobacteria bacterium]|nr:SDR family oxidoreductase [Deltaproteobacteria bacterium]
MIVVTGSASGIGKATREHLEASGQQVLGIDLRDAECIADLATAEGRRAAIAAVAARCGGVVDGVVACAGVGPQVESRTLIVSLNYFGAQAILAGLHDQLARGKRPAAVAVSSNSAVLPTADGALADACLDGDEAHARDLAELLSGAQVYAASKLALARWVRRTAHGAQWAGAGIRLNAVAPGAVQTPLLQEGLDHPAFGPAIRNFPIPLGGFGSPAQIAAAIVFLLSEQAAFCCGSVLFVDGGTDAMLRPDSF